MFMQAAVQLVKNVQNVFKGKSPKGLLAYIAETPNYMGKQLTLNLSSLDSLEEALKANALYAIGYAAQMLAKKEPKVSQEEKISKHFQVDLVRAARAHAIYMVAMFFKRRIERITIKDKNVRKHLETLCNIYMCNQILVITSHK